MKRLFPNEIVENSQEKNFSRHSITTKVFYVFLLSVLTVLLGLLPFIRVDVGVRGQGLVRPVAEVVPVSSPASGNVQTWKATENRYVNRGEVLAVLDVPELAEQLRFNQQRRERLHLLLDDLKRLIQADSAMLHASVLLSSTRYQHSFREIRQQLDNQKQTIRQLRNQFQRKKYLVSRNAGTEIAMEDARIALDNALGQYKLMVEQQKNLWENDQTDLQNELTELESEYTRLNRQKARYTIRSPVSGTLQNVSGITPDSYVHNNQMLAEISPDTGLVAEVYISPRDIGLLREGMPVRMQIDAYDYNRWGVLTGAIISISDDIRIREGQPVYRIRCSLDQSHLELPNGFRGDIKKGMTLRARFIVSRRSLFQLLYDKVDDWLNPVRQASKHHPDNSK